VSTSTITPEVTGTYALDPTHSRIGFVARHAMVTKVRGAFNDVTGTGFFDPADPSKISIDLTIEATSIDTRNADRDAHLRSNDFFDMAHHPQITFTSTSVAATGAETFAVTGDLTIKGTTHPVTIDFTYEGAAKDPYGNERIGFEGSATINRKDWGVNFNAALETGGLLVSEKITLEFEVSAVRQDAAA
jgi:polyisoprenoid-binding protein YceI